MSDHTTDNYACLGAVALGASIVERHFTDSMDRKGPEIINSMDHSSAKELVEGSKIIALERGGKKGIVNEEKNVINFAYASVVSIKSIQKGEKLSEENIWVKRPGTGPFFAKDYEKLIGLTALKDIGNDKHIQKDDINF